MCTGKTRGLQTSGDGECAGDFDVMLDSVLGDRPRDEKKGGAGSGHQLEWGTSSPPAAPLLGTRGQNNQRDAM